MKTKKFIDLHCHTGEGSLRDTGSSCAQLVARQVELGATAMAITDHGTMTAVQDFRVACEKAGIKPIYGCEYYVDIGDGARTHLVVLAKDIDGFNAISKVCTASAYNMHNDRPIVTLEMLEEWFAPGKPGHGKVIGLSACMQGPLCRKLLSDFYIDKEIEKVRRKQSKDRSPDDATYLTIKADLDNLLKEYEDAKTASKENTQLANTKWKAQWNKAQRSGDPEAIAEAEKLKDAVDIATARKAELKLIEKRKGDIYRAKKDEITPFERSVERYLRFEESISSLEASKPSPEEARKAAEEQCEYFIALFGQENFYIELQNHNINEEIFAMPILADIAKAYKLKCVVTNDVHFAKIEDTLTRHYNHVQYQNYSWTDIEPQDYELYIKTDKEMDRILSPILSSEIIREGLENTHYIANQCNVIFDIKPHYPVFPCKEGAKIRLRRLISAGKKKIKDWTPEYQKRLEYELRVIENMGFSDYLCIVEDFLNYARIIGKLDLESKEFLDDPYNLPKLRKLAKGQVGEGCGPGRGSAAGSLVCYLVGITNINPIPEDLLFERFLNPARVTMPDIDSDIPPRVRPWVIGYIKHVYGDKAIAQIMTRAYFGAKSAIQAAARVMGKRDGDEKLYLGISLEMSKSIEDANASLEDLKENLVDTENPITEDIFNIAKALEGLPSGYGTHAAGIVVSDNDDISDYTPLINISGAIDTQLDLNWVEPMGMLKLDLLGLRNLGIITECEKAVQREYGVNLSMDEFPYEPEVFSEIFAKGLTDGVFQFESDGMKKLLMNFGPESISDLTLLNAMFRPGPLQYIDDVTAVKKGEKSPEYIIPEMAEILDVTYGKPIYQEQIMSVFNRFAGFSLGEADVIRRLMSKKKVEAFTAYKDKFIEGLCEAGATKKNAEKFWDELLNFSQYAFNKSHARAYAEVAYATAYLKYKYPEAYAVGLLNYTPKDKMPKMIIDTKNQGVNLCCPDINYSEADFVIRGSKVFFGLRPIPQVAASATEIIEERRANGKFSSFKDFILRVNPKKNVCENLIKAGAFDSFCKSRASLLSALPLLLELSKNINDKKNIIATETDEKKTDRARLALKKYQTEFDEYEYPDIFDGAEKLVEEKDLLGYYISSHPMDGIRKKVFLNTLLPEENYTVAAVIDSIEEKITKTGKKMVVFQISDTSGILPGVMFPSDYERVTEELKENEIFSFKGTLKQEGDENAKFVVKYINKYHKSKAPIVISIPTWGAYKKHQDKLLPFTDPNGESLSVFIESNKKTYKVSGKFSKDIEKADINWEE